MHKNSPSVLLGKLHIENPGPFFTACAAPRLPPLIPIPVAQRRFHVCHQTLRSQPHMEKEEVTVPTLHRTASKRLSKKLLSSAHLKFKRERKKKNKKDKLGRIFLGSELFMKFRFEVKRGQAAAAGQHRRSGAGRDALTDPTPPQCQSFPWMLSPPRVTRSPWGTAWHPTPSL